MSNMFTRNRSPMFAAVTALSAVGLLTVPTPAQADPACEKYELPSNFRVLQSDGWEVDIPASGQQLNGTVEGEVPGEVKYQLGHPSGGINGNKIDFTVDWNNGHRSHYYGTVLGDGYGSGERDDVRLVGAGPDNTTWHTAEPLICIPAAADKGPPPVVDPVPVPVPDADTEPVGRPDRDNDGLFDDDETNVYFTDPDDPDTDNDGVSDGEEDDNGTDPNNFFDN